MQSTRISRLDARGASLIEVLAALGIVITMAMVVLPFFSNQRKVINQYEPTGLCQGYLSRAAARLESGGAFMTETPEFVYGSTSLTTAGDWANVPDIFYAPAAKPVSFNPDNTRTFSDRFYELGAPKAGSHYMLYKVRPPKDYTRADAKVIHAEADGVMLYTPLLIKGAVADVADMYNNGLYHADFGPAPAYVIGKEGTLDPRYAMEIQMRVDRILLTDKSIANTSNKFWPIPRNAYGNTDASDVSKYRISTVEDTIAKVKGLNPFFAIAQFPQAGDGIEMSWDYGFQVTFKGKLQELASGAYSDCSTTQEYFLPSDFHNVVSYRSDFDFLTPPSTSVTSPQALVTQKLSSKFDSYSDVVADPTFLSIFFGTNFGTDSTGQPNVRFGKNRPECSQDGTKSKTFEFRLSFKNINKEPGAIPMCLDTSVRPPDLLDNSGKDFYMWCNGGAGAQTLITNDFLPGQTGFVPCEKMRFCGQTPEAVTFTNTTDVSGNSTYTYAYKYTIRNDGNAGRNRLWGCDVSFSTAIVDPAGNLSYVPRSDGGSIIDTSAILGINRPFISSIVPKIYFKPPPCYTCKCKPSKSGKSWFIAVLAVIAVGVAMFFGVPIVYTGLTSTLASSGVTLAVAQGVAGVIITAVSTCMFQFSGMTGGKCNPDNSMKDTQGDYRACKSQDKVPKCSNGFTCNNVTAPPAMNFDTDLPAGLTDQSALGYCSYEVKKRVTDGVTWQVEMGARKDPNGPIDFNGLINFADPTPKLDPNAAYTPINGTSNYTMLDKQNGLYCFSQWKCVWNGSHGEWQLDSGTVDGAAGVPYEACWKIKGGTELKFLPTGKVTPGVTTCLKVDTDPGTTQLQKCGDFDIACYDGTEIYDIDALNLDFGGITKIAGKRTNAPATVFPSTSYLPVEKANANCKLATADCGPTPCATPPVKGPYSPGDGSTYPRNNTCPTATTDLTPPCPLSCSMSGASCVANNPAYGSCTYKPAVGATPAYCAPSAATCYKKSFYQFDSWNGCQPPAAIKYHMVNATTGMMCYEDYTSGMASLPLCFESTGTLTSGHLDMTCPGGPLCL